MSMSKTVAVRCGRHSRTASPRAGLVLLAALVVFASVVIGSTDAAAQADRYGGVWHPGQGTGAFVPIAAGMTLADVMNYRDWWRESDSFRITDIEVVPQGCPSDEQDLFATQWEVGNWEDKLEVFPSLVALQTAIVQRCEEGFQLVDFEIWETLCEGEDYIALFREGDCSLEQVPFIDSASSEAFGDLVTQHSLSGYTLVDFEIYMPAHQLPLEIHVIGVWYPGSSNQEFLALDRPGFETEMIAREGLMTLMDMESYRPWPTDGQSAPRHVAALWESLPEENADDHEVGEVLAKFGELVYMEETTRKLVDFEVYPNTLDTRFTSVFDSYLNGIGGGYSIVVLQAGETVSSDAQGWARSYMSADGGVLMGLDTRGPVASVTKFFTALGVLRYAETQPDVNGWLDQPFTWYLPQDFGPFGAGVETVTIRELLSQRTGLATFQPMVSPVDSPGLFRDVMRLWLADPLADLNKNYKYQNVHFELLGLMMDEVILPWTTNSPTPWHDWMNQEVFANAGVGPLVCGGTSVDALSYPVFSSPDGVQWADSSWPCAGNGTGAAMFWASTLDLAKVSWAFRHGDIVSAPTVTMALDEGLGLDPPYPGGILSSGTAGERLYTKNGGLCGFNGRGETVGTETLIARFDDYNFDDDGVGGSFSPVPPPPPPPPTATNDYIYETGYRDFDIGIMVHSTSYAEPCPPKGVPAPPRGFPWPKTMLQEALRQPENW